MARVLGRATVSIAGDPVWNGITQLIDLERELGVRSTWFVLCGAPSLQSALAGDLTYGPDSSRLRRILDLLATERHQVGLHGSFATMDSAERFGAERAQISRLAGGDTRAVRQHYLRMRPGRTQRLMRQAGFQYDATYGFPDRNGFRLGVADVVPGWDAEEERESGLVEVPLVWMDRALSKYSGVENPEAWVADGLELARACAECEGLWVGLWHPNLVPALGFPGAPAALRALLQGLLRDRPFVATLDGIVDWRVARRSVRAIAQATDGTLRLDGAARCPEIALEDAAGRTVQIAPWPRR
jgi:hypothetical protein